MLDYNTLSDKDKKYVDEREASEMRIIENHYGTVSTKNAIICQVLDENIHACTSDLLTVAMAVKKMKNKEYRQSLLDRYHDIELVALAFERLKQKNSQL